jgi:hypothetical protein
MLAACSPQISKPTISRNPMRISWASRASWTHRARSLCRGRGQIQTDAPKPG